MLIAHEEAFHRNYLEDVLAGSGAIIAGEAGDPATAAARLEIEPLPAVLVLSPLLPGGEALVLARLAASLGLAIVLVEPVRGSGAALPADAVLTRPYAGFQVVEAVATLLAGREAVAQASISPDVGGHSG